MSDSHPSQRLRVPGAVVAGLMTLRCGPQNAVLPVLCGVAAKVAVESLQGSLWICPYLQCLQTGNSVVASYCTTRQCSNKCGVLGPSYWTHICLSSLVIRTPAGQLSWQYWQIRTVRISASGTKASPEQFLKMCAVRLVGAKYITP